MNASGSWKKERRRRPGCVTLSLQQKLVQTVIGDEQVQTMDFGGTESRDGGSVGSRNCKVKSRAVVVRCTGAGEEMQLLRELYSRGLI